MDTLKWDSLPGLCIVFATLALYAMPQGPKPIWPLLSVLCLIAVLGVRRPPDLIPPLVRSISPAVVAVECVVLVAVEDEDAGVTRLVPSQSGGSGVIVSPDGLVVTNHHVARDAVAITVVLYSGERVAATLVGSNEEADLAVLKLPRSALPFLPLGKAEELSLGQRIVSMGNGHGLGRSGDLSVTVGVVSGLSRRIAGYLWYEMDAPIYPGCSGGPVCDLSGAVVGINVALSSHLKPFFIPMDRANRDVIRGISGGRIK